jgi:hypothetical protein
MHADERGPTAPQQTPETDKRERHWQTRESLQRQKCFLTFGFFST